MVAAGDYPCAPETIAGRGRLFEENDIIALYVCACELRKKEVRPSTAGQIACQVRTVLHERPEANVIAVSRDFVSSRVFIARPPEGDGNLAPFEITDHPDVLSITSYNIARVRELVQLGIAEEAQIIGPQDE